MAEIDKWKMEKNLQRALALEFVKDYCEKNNLSLEKLKRKNLKFPTMNVDLCTQAKLNL